MEIKLKQSKLEYTAQEPYAQEFEEVLNEAVNSADVSEMSLQDFLIHLNEVGKEMHTRQEGNRAENVQNSTHL